MKILLVKSYPKLTSVGYLAKELKTRGHDVHILVPWEHPDCEKARNLGISVHIINFQILESSKVRKVAISIKSLKEIIKTIKINSFDVIHLNLSSARLFGRLAALFSKKRTVVSTIHGFEATYERWTNWIDDVTVAVSLAVKRYLILRGVPKNKIVTIPSGIDIEEIDKIPEDKFYLHKELGLDPAVKLIGMVAYFYDLTTKGHKVFIDAARIVSQRFSDVRFVIIGSNLLTTGCKEYFEDYTKETGIKDKVYFLGERNDVPSIMSSLYLHVLPSLSEGCPLALFEAMARKIPNISSNIESIKEIIKNTENGILFEPGNPHSLAQSIIYLLNNPDEARRIGLAGRKRFENKFKARDMAEKYDDLFQRIVSKKAGIK